jgi:hypothetical protein
MDPQSVQQAARRARCSTRSRRGAGDRANRERRLDGLAVDVLVALRVQDRRLRRPRPARPPTGRVLEEERPSVPATR